MEIGVFFRQNISGKGAFLQVDNTEGLHILHWSGGTGTYTLPVRSGRPCGRAAPSATTARLAGGRLNQYMELRGGY